MNQVVRDLLSVEACAKEGGVVRAPGRGQGESIGIALWWKEPGVHTILKESQSRSAEGTRGAQHRTSQRGQRKSGQAQLYRPWQGVLILV